MALEKSVDAAWKNYIPDIPPGSSVLDVINDRIAEREEAIKALNGKEGYSTLTPMQIQTQVVQEVTRSLQTSANMLRSYRRAMAVSRSAQPKVD
jgi:hypothetical protein